MNYIEEYNELVQQLSSEYAKRYTMLERDDIGQELWVWFVGHPNKYKEWSATHIDKFLRCLFGGAQYKVCAVYCVSMSRFFVSKPLSDLAT